MSAPGRQDIIWLAGVVDCAKSVGVQPIRLTTRPDAAGRRRTYEGNRPQIIFRTSKDVVRERIKSILTSAGIRFTERTAERAIQVMSQEGTLTLARMLRPYVAFGEALDEIVDFVAERRRVRASGRDRTR